MTKETTYALTAQYLADSAQFGRSNAERERAAVDRMIAKAPTASRARPPHVRYAVTLFLGALPSLLLVTDPETLYDCSLDYSHERDHARISERTSHS